MFVENLPNDLDLGYPGKAKDAITIIFGIYFFYISKVVFGNILAVWQFSCPFFQFVLAETSIVTIHCVWLILYRHMNQ